jgi:hypothetical protein
MRNTTKPCDNCFFHQKSAACTEYCDTRPEILLKDPKGGKKTWRFINNLNRCVCVVKIDDCVISSENKCDYLVLLCDDTGKAAFFVELKGRNFEHSCTQIAETIPKLKQYLPDFCIYARISTNNPPPSSPNRLTTSQKKAIHKIQAALAQETNKSCTRKKFNYQNSSTYDILS